MSLKYTNKLQGKLVVVVGGTSGIGFAVAEAAVEHGAIVVVASSQQEKVNRAIHRIQQAYADAADRIRGKTVDLSSENVEEQIHALYTFATEAAAAAAAGGSKPRKIDHIVMTAGEGFGTVPLEDVTPRVVSDLYKVRMVGCTMLAKLAMQYLDISAASSFTLTSGVSDAKPTVGWTAMAPVGAAVRGLTHALANDMKPVRVNCVCPGAVKTELFDKFARDRLDEILDMYRAKTLTGHVGTPEDLAECYICVMKNKFMTGQEITCDGGYLLC
jgi:NAD(P)-dependent dehydrogenase (short-subunit alcohol dehydrogenase family)